jgi:hypothetical protein
MAPQGLLEKTVEEYASKLMSGNMAEVNSVIESLEALRIRIPEGPHVRLQLSRTLQELAAFKRGAVLTKLVEQVLFASNGISSLQLEMFSSRALVKLAQSRVVAEFCLQGEGHAKLIATYLTVQVQTLEGKSANAAAELAEMLCMNGLEGLVHFARASEVFRDHLKQQGELGLFPALERFLSEASVRSRSPFSIQKCREHIARLMVSLALNDDSQAWVLERGFFNILAAIYRCQNPAVIPRDVKDGAVVICNLVFFWLIGLKRALRQ